ncbi:MAG TPA: AraC family transcriptional regulator [Bosea sp. (in: a-proteobacteria)]|jgi:AraC-like DNA-binding protein|uniref:helix-turn-helix transcriptional regulator n=1 Tax=Bosea sp. (in: a-proteobacteria) TaxID=1871050 RepID=UPI002DDD1541|nr:AraC family transcriptional regulator [Bosea sp. (in: a-proteobacteria)]HEV2552284.1 AraC family transcriptional regulator [Bosea sp. (in: a-proteobacteria)]
MQPPRPRDQPTAESSADRATHAFVSRDVAETQAWLNTLLRRDVRLESLGPDGFEVRLSAHTLAGAHLIRAEYPAGMRLKRGEAHDDLTIRIVAAGGSLYSAGPQTLAAVPGRGLAINTGLCETGEYGRGSVHTTFTLAGEEVARIIQSSFGRPATERLAIAASFDLASADGATIAGLLAAMEAGLTGEAPLARTPQAARLLRDALVLLVLARFPNPYAAWFETAAPAPAPWQIRRAVAFIDAHDAGALTVQEVADAVGIGLRSLQEGFRKHKHVSPHDYIKQTRLARARSELLDPASTRSIEAIARHWGFVNRGHFALDYRNAFGEQPSQTRRRR